MLDAHAGVLPDEKLWQALRQDVSDLAQLQCKNSGCLLYTSRCV